MTMQRAPLLAIGIVMAALGCGATGADPSLRQNATEQFALGIEAFNQKSYAPAADNFTSAINAGGLNPDMYVEAAVKRAVCWGAEGKFAEALAELEKLEAGAPNLDQVYAARAFVLKKQGKASQANAALSQARKHNRTVKEFQ